MPQDRIHAPMTCTVVEVLVAIGQSVRAGQPLVIVEAMKMEHEVCAETDAQVLGVSARAGELVEQTLSRIAVGLVDCGVQQLVVAGGETSGAVVQALGVQQMSIGPQIDPGVPWTAARSSASSNPVLHLALKSGNFGTPDFFAKAFGVLA